ncbi:MAG: HlyD family efflux transporter periplasmic adaptor subunit [Acidobacteria bacterium]|nr:HlyD family efflux transporter periplasmic adaptor subunit [Acidobacteriota bacterium]
MKKIIFRLTIALVVAAAAWGGYRAIKELPGKESSTLATTKVRQGDVVVRTYARGELRAVRSATLTAPNLFGTVQVTKLAALGAFAREKDLIAEFDDSELLSRLEEKQLEIEQINENVKKSRAELAIRENQDQVELLSARYAVRRAELEVKRNPLISEIDAKRNNLSLEEARRRLQKLESDIKSRREQAQAELAVLQERLNKANLELNRERSRLNQVKVLSPMSGLVAIKQNRGTGFFFSGMQLPDIREGDQLQPGMPIVEVLDLSELEVIARIGELDRANLKEGQDVVIGLDALADARLNGKIKSMSGTASANVFSSDPAKKFDVMFSVDMQQLLKTLGATPDQISRVMATAEANRKKPPMTNPMAGMMAMFGGGGGAPGGGGGMMGGGGGGMGGMGGGGGSPGAGGGGAPGDMMGGGGAPGGGPGGGGGGFRMFGGGGAGGPGGASSITPEQMEKMKAAMAKAFGGKNPMEMSQEERMAAFAKVREEMQKAGVTMPARGQRKGGDEAKRGADGETKGGGQPGPAGGPPVMFGGMRGTGGDAGAPGAGADGQRRRGGDQMAAAGGGPGGGGGRRGGGGPPSASGGFGGFSQKEIDAAKLPPAPEESASQLDVLLRPGLLADVEIIVEKIPNAIYIPAQAIFQKEGKSVVYVKEGNKFVPRVIQPLKRSESLMIVSSGIKSGEEILMQDPDAKPSDKKKGAPKGESAPAMPMGMGGKKG